MPKVSIIVPVYGAEKYIERCARSLFEQTLDDIEFIFVDDCTPDRSIDILKVVIEKFRLRFGEKKYVVRIERMPMNSGQGAVRRHGIQLATGDYITFCDSDDFMPEDAQTISKGCIRAKSGTVIEDSGVREEIDRALIRQFDLLPVARKMVMEELANGQQN